MLATENMRGSSLFTNPFHDNAGGGGVKIEMNSCSKVKRSQFLLFRVVWKGDQRASVLQNDWDKPTKMPWIKKRYREAATKELNGESYLAKCWKTYTENLLNNDVDIDTLKEMGLFGMVRLSLEEFNIKTENLRKAESGASEVSKKVLRPRPSRPQTPAPVESNDDDDDDDVTNLTKLIEDVQLESVSPKRGDWIPRKELEVVTEQIFNSMCIEMLKALASLPPEVDPKEKSRWFANGTKFHVTLEDENIFSGIVDGALYCPPLSGYIAIVKTKRTLRYYHETVTNQIKMQESGEMVAWIHGDGKEILENCKEERTF